jgi:hypothetical protein
MSAASRGLIVASTIVMLVPGLTACGGASARTGTTSGALVVIEHTSRVSRVLGPIDEDDYAVLNLGHAATPVERRAIVATVRRYYAVAAAQRGAMACSMMYEPAIIETVEEGGGIPALRGRPCPVVMSGIFRRRHRQVVADRRSFRMLRIRSDGLNGSIVLRVPGSPRARWLRLRHVGHTWKPAQPLDGEMP